MKKLKYFNSYIINMKLFSNFDTKLKKRKQEQWIRQYWIDSVLLLSKSTLFRFLKLDLPLFLFFVASGFLIFWANYLMGGDGVFYGALPLISVWLFFVLPKLLKHLMDYYMDFAIITPKALYRYDQEWAFSRDLININVDSIKSFYVKKWGLLYSMFNNGNITFLTEWDAIIGEVTLFYMYAPEVKKYKISKIIGRI